MGNPDKRKSGGAGKAGASRGEIGGPDSPCGFGARKGFEENVTPQPQANSRNEDGAMAEFDRQFRTMFEATVDGIVVADSETRRFYTANLAFTRMSGYAPQEVRQLGIHDIHPPDTVSFVMQQFEKLLRHELTVARDIPVKRKDGSIFHADISSYPVTLAGKACLMGFFHDVSERKRAEDQLRDTESRFQSIMELYRTLVESEGETIAMVDRSGTFLFMNKTAATRLGGTPDDYVGKTMWDLFPRAIADRQAGSVRKVIDTGKGLNVVVETEVQGQRRWYNTTIEPIRDAAGKITAALIMGRDIHELHQARQELDQYREKMCRAEQLASLGALSATVAHEMTQPLTVSRLSLQEAMAELDATSGSPKVLESLKECLEGISDAAGRVERFRSFARQPSKEGFCDVRLQDVVARTIRLLEGKARERRVSLSIRGLSALSPVHANEKDMEQMCFALIENAIQAADGKRQRKLVISGHEHDVGITLRFEDTCGGIAPEHVDKIFRPFFTTKPFGEGTGLGLPIVDRVVTQAGGSIRVENRPGEGTAFCVTLPMQRPRA